MSKRKQRLRSCQLLEEWGHGGAFLSGGLRVKSHKGGRERDDMLVMRERRPERREAMSELH